MRTVVLGSGIAGVATAYYLAKLGHKVTVIDRQAEPALETSFANGGVIGATQIEPWPSPGLPLKIVQWIGHQDAPLLLHLKQLPRMWPWGVEFLRNCTEARFQRNMAANLRLTLYSLDGYAEIRAETGITYDLLARGALKIYLSREALDHAVRRSESLRSLGMPFRAVDVSECVKIEPALGDAASTLAGGIYFPREEVGDCRKFVVALAQRCTAMGVAFHFGTTIRGLSKSGDLMEAVETDRGRFEGERFVAALASYTPNLLQQVGLFVPICPVKGVTVTVSTDGWAEPVRSAVIDHSRLFGFIRLGDRLRISGSAEITGYDVTPAPARCEALTQKVLELFPSFGECMKGQKPHYWAGLRGNSPDGVPILGSTPIRNLFINAGHGPQGWTTGAGSARVVADLVADRSPELDLTDLTLERFN